MNEQIYSDIFILTHFPVYFLTSTIVESLRIAKRQIIKCFVESRNSVKCYNMYAMYVYWPDVIIIRYQLCVIEELDIYKISELLQAYILTKNQADLQLTDRILHSL